MILKDLQITMIKEVTHNKKSSNQENPKNQGSDNMKQNWEIKKLGEVCIVERGSSPRPIEKYQTNSPDGVNWIKIGDTKGVDKYIFTTKEKITKEGAEKSRYVKEGDFILSNSMSFGKPYIMKTDGYIHDGWFVFRLPAYLDKDYFYYLLTSPNVQEQIQSLGAGAIVKNISGDLVKKVDVTYPKSLPEQRRIVSILDECFAAIDKTKANAEQNLKNAKELFESYLQGVFEKKGDGWEEMKLGEVCEIVNGGTPKTENSEYWDGNIKWITPADLGKLKSIIVDNTSRTITELGLQKSSAKLFPANSVILSTRAPIGHLAINTVPMSTNQGCRGIIPSEKINVWYLYFFLKTNVKLLDSLGTGATFRELSGTALKNVKIPFPKSNEEQQTIVRQLDALRAETQKLETIYQKKLADLEELKKSILQKAFAGELRGDEPAEPKTEKAVMM
jgi:type I restriction enzyme, S subunit